MRWWRPILLRRSPVHLRAGASSSSGPLFSIRCHRRSSVAKKDQLSKPARGFTRCAAELARSVTPTAALLLHPWPGTFHWQYAMLGEGERQDDHQPPGRYAGAGLLERFVGLRLPMTASATGTCPRPEAPRARFHVRTLGVRRGSTPEANERWARPRRLRDCPVNRRSPRAARGSP